MIYRILVYKQNNYMFQSAFAFHTHNLLYHINPSMSFPFNWCRLGWLVGWLTNGYWISLPPPTSSLGLSSIVVAAVAAAVAVLLLRLRVRVVPGWQLSQSQCINISTHPSWIIIIIIIQSTTKQQSPSWLIRWKIDYSSEGTNFHSKLSLPRSGFHFRTSDIRT